MILSNLSQSMKRRVWLANGNSKFTACLAAEHSESESALEIR